jgi:hypothetical protein
MFGELAAALGGARMAAMDRRTGARRPIFRKHRTVDHFLSVKEPDMKSITIAANVAALTIASGATAAAPLAPERIDFGNCVRKS